MAGLIVRFNEGDAAVGRTAAGAQETTGFALVLQSELVGKNEKLAGIKSGERLIINGHGSPGTVGGLTAREMAKLLADSGLKGPVHILLLTCNGGLTGSPFALNLKVELVQGHKIMCSVLGVKGLLGRHRTTGEWVVCKAVGAAPEAVSASTTYATTCSF
jgi:hypothetical protein